MKNKAQSLVVVMVVIALVALFLRIAIIQFIGFNVAQNESNAQETLKLISTALENYAKAHFGVFPTSLEALTQTSPAYIDKEYINLVNEKGYNFDCLRLETSGYTCTARPQRCNLSGRKNFIMTTGQVMAAEDCGKKE